MIFENMVFDAVARGALLATLGLCWIIFCVRILGLRSFSKMTNFDFVSTIAIGSLLAGAAQATAWAGFVQPIAAVTVLFGLQGVLALSRRHTAVLASVIGNAPVLLMENGVFHDKALDATRVTRSDITAKLREANAVNMDDVRAVILEATGDVSVLHGGDVDAALLDGVRRMS